MRFACAGFWPGRSAILPRPLASTTTRSTALRAERYAGRPETIAAMRKALEKAGVEFTNGKELGVRCVVELVPELVPTNEVQEGSNGTTVTPELPICAKMLICGDR